jgi:phosphate transport system permease protein
MRDTLRRATEFVIESIVRLSGVLAIVFVVAIFGFLVREAAPILREVSLGEMLRGTRWLPTSTPPQFGMLPLILGSALVTVAAALIGVPLGVGCAIYIGELASPWLREVLKSTVEFLAAIPSVVLGLLGLLVLAPFLRELLDLPVGLTALTGAGMLAFMALPTIVSVSEDALNAVPDSFRRNSLALGATRWQTISRVVVPAARSGIVAATMLGIGRVVGETMTVLMVTGNAAVMPTKLSSLLRPVRTITATIAAEMGETPQYSDHYHALFLLGAFLFAITFLVNLLGDLAVHRGQVR